MKAKLFYAEDRMVASKDPVWLQSAFVMLTRIFDRVGIRKNILKNVGMLCRPCWSADVRADEAYTRQMIEEGLSFKEKKREQVLCPE